MDYKGNDFYCDMALSEKINLKIEFESDSILAFHHTKPSFRTHIVVIPKKHISSLLEADSELLLEIMTVVKDIATKVMKINSGCRVITNLGRYQDSKHFHWHVVDGVIESN